MYASPPSHVFLLYMDITNTRESSMHTAHSSTGTNLLAQCTSIESSHYSSFQQHKGAEHVTIQHPLPGEGIKRMSAHRYPHAFRSNETSHFSKPRNPIQPFPLNSIMLIVSVGSERVGTKASLSAAQIHRDHRVPSRGLPAPIDDTFLEGRRQRSVSRPAFTLFAGGGDTISCAFAAVRLSSLGQST